MIDVHQPIPTITMMNCTIVKSSACMLSPFLGLSRNCLEYTLFLEECKSFFYFFLEEEMVKKRGAADVTSRLLNVFDKADIQIRK